MRLISKSAELRLNDRNIEEADRQELVASLANIDGAIKTSTFTGSRCAGYAFITNASMITKKI